MSKHQHSGLPSYRRTKPAKANFNDKRTLCTLLVYMLIDDVYLSRSDIILTYLPTEVLFHKSFMTVALGESQDRYNFKFIYK